MLINNDFVNKIDLIVSSTTKESDRFYQVGRQSSSTASKVYILTLNCLGLRKYYFENFGRELLFKANWFKVSPNIVIDKTARLAHLIDGKNRVLTSLEVTIINDNLKLENHWENSTSPLKNHWLSVKTGDDLIKNKELLEVLKLEFLLDKTASNPLKTSLASNLAKAVDLPLRKQLLELYTLLPNSQIANINNIISDLNPLTPASLFALEAAIKKNKPTELVRIYHEISKFSYTPQTRVLLLLLLLNSKEGVKFCPDNINPIITGQIRLLNVYDLLNYLDYKNHNNPEDLPFLITTGRKLASLLSGPETKHNSVFLHFLAIIQTQIPYDLSYPEKMCAIAKLVHAYDFKSLKQFHSDYGFVRFGPKTKQSIFLGISQDLNRSTTNDKRMEVLYRMQKKYSQPFIENYVAEFITPPDYISINPEKHEAILNYLHKCSPIFRGLVETRFKNYNLNQRYEFTKLSPKEQFIQILHLGRDFNDIISPEFFELFLNYPFERADIAYDRFIEFAFSPNISFFLLLRKTLEKELHSKGYNYADTLPNEAIVEFIVTSVTPFDNKAQSELEIKQILFKKWLTNTAKNSKTGRLIDPKKVDSFVKFFTRKVNSSEHFLRHKSQDTRIRNYKKLFKMGLKLILNDNISPQIAARTVMEYFTTVPGHLLSEIKPMSEVVSQQDLEAVTEASKKRIVSFDDLFEKIEKDPFKFIFTLTTSFLTGLLEEKDRGVVLSLIKQFEDDKNLEGVLRDLIKIDNKSSQKPYGYISLFFDKAALLNNIYQNLDRFIIDLDASTHQETGPYVKGWNEIFKTINSGRFQEKFHKFRTAIVVSSMVTNAAVSQASFVCKVISYLLKRNIDGMVQGLLKKNNIQTTPESEAALKEMLKKAIDLLTPSIIKLLQNHENLVHDINQIIDCLHLGQLDDARKKRFQRSVLNLTINFINDMKKEAGAIESALDGLYQNYAE